MSLSAKVVKAAPGLKGFDTITPLTTATAAQYVAKGFHFCVRYVPRDAHSSFVDISLNETQAILGGGLALMLVQHPLKPGWSPTADLGKQFGQAAADYAGHAGYLSGATIWLDLEGVKTGTAHSDVVDYCNAWFAAVQSGSYLSGLYIGADPILSAEEAYKDLTTKQYWRGGSSAASGVPQDIPVRGYSLVQTISNPGTPQEFDTDVTQNDHFGNGVAWMVHQP